MQFDYPSYLSSFSQQLQQKLSQVSKLYLELSGNIIDQSNVTKIFPSFAPDTYKKVFAPYKYDMEILFCIKAQDIIDDLPMGEDQKPFRDFIWTYLKKIENQFGVRPHIVINLIDIENMYDIIFAFETYFQKLGYRVWEKYKIKSYTHDMKYLLSEDGFGNDDHIPVTKKLILIAGLAPECGKLNTAVAQIYLDQEIEIEADYAKVEFLQNYQQEDEESEIEEPQRSIEKFTFIQDAYKLLKKTIPQHIEEIQIGIIQEEK